MRRVFTFYFIIRKAKRFGWIYEKNKIADTYEFRKSLRNLDVVYKFERYSDLVTIIITTAAGNMRVNHFTLTDGLISLLFKYPLISFILTKDGGQS